MILQFYHIKLNSYLFLLFRLARKVTIEGCKQASTSTYVKIGESKELPQRNAGLQNESVTLSDNAPLNSIKFIV